MNILITTCARGGSKGIPGKNIKLLNGKPLIAYTIEAGKKFAKKNGADFSLSTDSMEIKKVAEEWGLFTKYERPSELATDAAGKIGAIRDLWKFEERERGKKYDYVIDMDITSPMRTQEDLEQALQLLVNRPNALNIFSVSHAHRNPYFNMVELKENGYATVVKNSNDIKSRQAAPKVYDMNASFYIFRRAYFEDKWEISTTPQSLAYVMTHRCFDLDEPTDFAIMEIMLREKLLDFEI